MIRRAVKLTSATDVTADSTTTIVGVPHSRGLIVASVRAYAAGDIDMSGAGIRVGKRLLLASEGGQIAAGNGFFQTEREGSKLIMSAPAGAVDISGSTLKAGRKMQTLAGQGVSATGCSIDVTGQKASRVEVLLGGRLGGFLECGNCY